MKDMIIAKFWTSSCCSMSPSQPLAAYRPSLLCLLEHRDSFAVFVKPGLEQFGSGWTSQSATYLTYQSVRVEEGMSGVGLACATQNLEFGR